MTSGLRALWLLFIPTPAPGSTSQAWWKSTPGGWKFMVFSLSLALLGSLVLSGLGNAYKVASDPGSSDLSQLQTWGPASLQLRPQIQEMQLNARFRQISQSPTGPSIPVALVGPDDMTQLMRQILRHGSVEEVDPDSVCNSCVVLEWFPSQGWHAQYIPPAQPLDDQVDAEQEILLIISSIRKGVLAQEQASPPIIKIASSQSRAAIFSAIASSLVGLSHFILLALSWMMIMSMGLRGYQWDMHRSTGRLEPWVVSQHPTWVIYLSQLARQAFACFFLFGGFLLLCHIHDVPLVWSWAFSAWAVLPFACMFVGIWGMLATVLFHHSKGRMFARLLLSPVIVGMFWAFRLMAIYMALRWQEPFVAWQSLDKVVSSWPYLLAAIPTIALASFALIALVQWRIGPRRQGLRRTV